MEHLALHDKTNKNNLLSSKKRKTRVAPISVFLLILLAIDTVSYLILRNEIFVVFYTKGLFLFSILYIIVKFNKLYKADRIAILIFSILLLKLIIESLMGYGSMLVYPSVAAVIFPFVYVYTIKTFIRNIEVDFVSLLSKTIIIFYFIFMIIYGKDFDFFVTPVHLEETGPFSGDTRVLHANSILLLVIPFLFFLNKLLKKVTLISIAGFFVTFLIILIHQHRTVWVFTTLATGFFFYLNNREPTSSVKLKKGIKIILILIVGFIFLFIFLPDLQNLFIERLVDIADPLNEDNTGGFRYLQILAYLDYFVKKPLFGWTFSGFELPNPFNSGVWEEGTGHHFHDAYIEVLFYFGITGLLLKYYPLYKIAKQATKNKLSENSKILSAFCISGFLYSFSYVPPLAFWAVVGICLFYIEKDIKFKIEK